MKVNWIKCSDGLPSSFDRFWAFDGEYVIDAFFCMSEFYFDSDCEHNIKGVTHYAEIEYPEPPIDDHECSDNESEDRGYSCLIHCKKYKCHKCGREREEITSDEII